MLHFLTDVTKAFESGDINLQEEAQLARLTADRLGCSPHAACASRAELLPSYLAEKGSAAPACENCSASCLQRRAPPSR